MVVEFGPRARVGNRPAHDATRARRTRCRRQGARVRPRPRAPLDDTAPAGIRDDLVTPRSAGGRLEWLRQMTRICYFKWSVPGDRHEPVSYTHLRAHETPE